MINSQSIIDAIRAAHGEDDRFLPLHAPVFSHSAIQFANECIETGWVSSAGAFVDRFEKELCDFTGAKRAVAVVNGTAALHVALLLAGVQPGDEVLIPSLTFVATGNAVHYCHAVPHFVDVEENTLGVCATKLRNHLETETERRKDGLYNKITNRKISALVGMHTFGHPFDLDSVLNVCKDYDIPLVEDAAESIGSYYKNKHTGLFGKLGILSFNGNKTITTGGGGAILTNDEALADRAKHLTTTAKKPHPYKYIHDAIGFNYRMPNINAALGCSQLGDLPEILQFKQALAVSYQESFSGVEEASFFTGTPVSKSNFWLNAILLNRSAQDVHEDVLAQLNAAGLLCRPIWHPLHQLPIYSHCPHADMVSTETLAHQVINIPSSPKIVGGLTG